MSATASILLVEDNAITRKMVRFALEKHGFQVVEAPDGAAAVRAFGQEPIALVLQDLVLPDVDGFELVQRLRALPGGTEIPILAVSGLLTKIEEARVSAVGFDDVIAKPVEPSRLVQIVRSHMPQARSAEDVFGRGRRVLVVDDDPVQGKLVSFRLQKAGFVIERAGDGAEALEAARRRRPDAIVSDVLMPRMDGFGLCVGVRREPGMARVPVILITNSYVESADRDLARRAGATDLVLRTPELRDVLLALRTGLAGTAASRGDEGAGAADGDLERDRMNRMMSQLERQVSLNAGATRRAALLSAELSVLHGISEALATRHDIDDALRLVLAACFDAGGISVGALYLDDPGGGRVIRFGVEEDRYRDLPRLLADRRLLDAARRSGTLVIIPSDAVPEELGREVLERTGSSAALLAPLAHKDVQLGALLMASDSVELLTDDRVLFAEAVAAQISQALALTRAFSEKDVSEAEARRHATLLQSILENIADGVVVADEDHRIIAWNPAAEGMVGPRPAVIDAWAGADRVFRPDQVTPFPSDDWPLVRALRGEAVDRIQMFLLGRKTGGTWLSANARPLRDESGSLRGGVAVFRDITAEKAAQAQLMVADRMVSVGMLAAGVAHEINNPLSALMANLEIATQDASALARTAGGGAVTKELLEALADARHAADRVRKIARDLRIFSRSEEDVHAVIDIERVLESAVRMAWNEVRHRAQLERDFHPVPPVLGNESRLGQVFLNLVMNAAQAIQEGAADRNRIRVGTRQDEHGRVVVEIADTGVGMPPEVQAQLFTPFFTTKPVGIGTGLGLTICQRLVGAMGGEIAVESAVGMGTTFRVVLPAAEAVAGSGARTTGPVPEVEPARRRGRVLVIDDEPMIATAVRRAIEAEHEVVTLTGAVEALQRLAAGERFDVILCDLMMPVMTGMDLHRELSKLDPDQAAHMIFLTGGAFTAKARAFLDGVSNIRLEKPFDLANLRVVVNARIAPP